MNGDLKQSWQIPYYAVIFSSERSMADVEGYEETGNRMVELAGQQNGFLGLESFRNADGVGVTISYWKSLEDIKRWKGNLEHQEAQDKGRKNWYNYYKTRICKVEHEYQFQNL